MKIKGRYFTCLLECCDGSYYTGMTGDLDRRFAEHSEGRDANCYTFNRRPLCLVYYEAYRDVKEAIARETQLKGWSRKKKAALILGDFGELSVLAKSRKRNDSL